ncbi:hypothetical protein HY416_00545 [Candidatus Kaiserbacteria bacterium]|nr:hypothetical protein [Candidatus Kaiserbacteria bacterium]
MNEGAPKAKKISPERLSINTVQEEDSDSTEMAPDEAATAVQEAMKKGQEVLPPQQTEMIAEEVKGTGGVLQRFGGRTKRTIMFGLVGLSLLAASPRWSEGAEKKGSGERIEEVAKNRTEADYAKAWKVLEAYGVKRSPDVERTEKLGEQIAPGSRAMKIEGEVMGVAEKLVHTLNTLATRVITGMDKVKRSYGLPEAAPDFEQTVATLQKQLESADSFDVALKDFSRGDSVFRSSDSLDFAREQLRAGEALIAYWKDPKNKAILDKKSSAKKILDRLEQKEKTDLLNRNETELKKEALRILGEESLQSSGSGKQGGSETPQQRGGTELDKVPGQLEKSGRELRESADNLGRIMQEYRKQVEELNKKK